MNVFVFPYGVVLTAGLVTKLRLPDFQVAVERSCFVNKRMKKYTQYVEKYYRMTINDVSCVVFPRFLFAALSRNLIELDRPPIPSFVHETPSRRLIDHDFSVLPNFQPYDYQTRIVDRIVNEHFTSERINSCRASCLLKLDTGLGKSFVVAEIIRRTKYRTVIIVPQIELATQFKADLHGVFGNSLKISLDDTISSDICILVINSALNLDKAFFNQFALTVFDEAPAYCTDTRKAIFFIAKQYAAIGMSATPFRRDNMHILLRDHLGWTVDQADFDLVDGDFTVNYTMHPYISPDAYKAPQKTAATGSISFMVSCRDCLSYDAARNQQIVDLSITLYRRGRPHFIFTIIVDHARVLAEMINLRLNELDSAGHRGTINVLAGHDQTYSLRDSSIVVATYSKGAIGISINKMTAAIWAMPPFETQYTQLVGRITRKNAQNPAADKIPREIHIIRDSAYWVRSHYDRMDERLRITNENLVARHDVPAVGADITPMDY